MQSRTRPLCFSRGITKLKKLGICTGIGYPLSLEKRLAGISEAGFDFVCLDFEKELEKTETSWENQLKLAQDYSLPVEAVHLTGKHMNAIWANVPEAEFVTRRLINELRDLRSLGLSCGVAHITWGMERPCPPGKEALRRFERIAEAAERFDVKLALENSVFPEYVHYVLGNIKSDHLGFCYDSGHENAFTPDENYLERYADRLFTVHLHDNDGTRDTHCVPFTGTIDWSEKVHMLKNTEFFSKKVILEIGVQPDKTFSRLMLESYEAARTLAEM